MLLYDDRDEGVLGIVSEFSQAINIILSDYLDHPYTMEVDRFGSACSLPHAAAPD
jgi:hypothetical protein